MRTCKRRHEHAAMREEGASPSPPLLGRSAVQHDPAAAFPCVQHDTRPRGWHGMPKRQRAV